MSDCFQFFYSRSEITRMTDEFRDCFVVSLFFVDEFFSCRDVFFERVKKAMMF